MKNFLHGVINFFSNKVIYAITFVLAGGCLYYAKIVSDRLNLKNVTNMGRFLDYVFPNPEGYFLGLLVVVLSVMLFASLTISCVKLSYVPVINIACGLISLIGMVVAMVVASHFINTMFFAIIVTIAGFALVKIFFDN